MSSMFGAESAPPPPMPSLFPSQAAPALHGASNGEIEDELEGDEVLALAEWVWGSFRPGETITSEERPKRLNHSPGEGKVTSETTARMGATSGTEMSVVSESSINK